MSDGLKHSVKRVIAYIDGFNLYYGIREDGERHLYWVDLKALFERLLRRSDHLVEVK